jgi:azurin
MTDSSATMRRTTVSTASGASTTSATSTDRCLPVRDRVYTSRADARVMAHGKISGGNPSTAQT